MKPEVHIYEDDRALARALAADVLRAAADALAARGAFRLAIPGGSAAEWLGRGLTAAGADVLNWDWFWVDERCVAADDPRCNFRQARQEFLGPLGVPEDRIHAIDGALGAVAAADAYEDELKRVFGDRGMPRFDLVLLGVGEDGHVASLFPGHPALAESVRWAVPIDDAPKPPPERVTLTLPVLNAARRVIVAAAGSGKAAAVARALAGDPAGDLPPAGRVRPTDGARMWMLDAAAASGEKEPS